MSELDDRPVIQKCDPNGPVMLMATPPKENDALITSVFLFSKVICFGLCLIAISVQSVSCLFLTLAAPKGGAQLRYHAVLWQRHKFKSHLYNHRNKSIDFCFWVILSRLSAHGHGNFPPSLKWGIDMHVNKTTVNKNVLRIFSQSYSSKNPIILSLMSLLCSLSP